MDESENLNDAPACMMSLTLMMPGLLVCLLSVLGEVQVIIFSEAWRPEVCLFSVGA